MAQEKVNGEEKDMAQEKVNHQQKVNDQEKESIQETADDQENNLFKEKYDHVNLVNLESQNIYIYIYIYIYSLGFRYKEGSFLKLLVSLFGVDASTELVAAL